MKKAIPNLITQLNLLLGCCALVALFYNKLEYVPYLIAFGMLADYADGLVARALKVNSVLGKELDSLADMVSFGLVPGAIFFKLLEISFSRTETYTEQEILLFAIPGFILTAASALRLAKFNIDTRQSDNFIGLATPACTFFVVGLLIIYTYNLKGLADFILNPYLLYGCVVLLSYLLNAEIPLFSFKFKNLKWKGNEMRYAYIVCSWTLLLAVGLVTMPLVILIYIPFSIADRLFFNKQPV